MAVRGKAFTLPKTVKIGGKRMKVIVHRGNLDKEDEAGYYNPTQYEIHVDMLDSDGKQVDDYFALHTFLHESFHAIDDLFCDGKLFGGQDSDDEDDHMMMNQFCHGLIQFLQENRVLNRDKFWKPKKAKKREKTCSKKSDPTAS